MQQIINQKRIQLLEYVIQNKDRIFYMFTDKLEYGDKYNFKLLIYPTIQIQYYKKPADFYDFGETYSYEYVYIVIDDINYCIDIENTKNTKEYSLCSELYNILQKLINEQKEHVDNFDEDDSVEEILISQKVEELFKLDKTLNKLKIG